MSQYHHYIPRFVLNKFAYDYSKSKKFKGKQEGLLHLIDVQSQQFSLGEVSRTCGTQDLYRDPNASDEMWVENSLSDLESKTSNTLSNICKAVDQNQDHVEILEKDIHVLFKFLNVSMRRSVYYRDEVADPYRENDFMFQRLFAASGDGVRPATPNEFWLDSLIYLLKTDHDTILTAAETQNQAAAVTYKYFFENHGVQIWKAAEGYEYFLNERFIEFEGDTQSYLGAEETGAGHRLLWMTTNDMNHLILPVAPSVAVVFCNESKCWDSPFADAMHRAKKPYPQSSYLKDAPHKDILEVSRPSVKRGKKRWPPTVAWRINIGSLSRQHHQVIASYSLSHAEHFVICKRRACFERTKRGFEDFSRKNNERWERQGIRFYPHKVQRKEKDDHGVPLSKSKLDAIADDHVSALEDLIKIISTTREPLARTKENAIKSWLAVRAISFIEGRRPSPSPSDFESDQARVLHPALKRAFEAAYPAKPADHKNLMTIDFWEFFSYGIGEDTFATLATNIDSKVLEVVREETFSNYCSATVSTSAPNAGFVLRTDEKSREKDEESSPAVWHDPAFESMFRAAKRFELLRWMFEERQDILADFVRQLSASMMDLQPKMVRIRARRE